MAYWKPVAVSANNIMSRQTWIIIIETVITHYSCCKHVKGVLSPLHTLQTPCTLTRAHTIIL